MKSIVTVRRGVPQHWVGDGFPVRTLFSYQEDAQQTSPFLLLDYAGPHTFAPAAAQRGVGEHPHRGFETVTVVMHGELEHRDSAGNRGTVGPGDVQWMTAASGVVHEEFHSQRFTAAGGMFEMIQLWVNLPSTDKMSSPRYQEIPALDIPAFPLREGAGRVRVIAGNYRGTMGPARTVTPMDVWQLELSEGHQTTFDLPHGRPVVVVVQNGAMKVNDDEQLEGVSLVILDREGDRVAVSAISDSAALILCGEPIDEPVVGRGPFVMNTADEIRQAVADFQQGKMGRLE